MKIIYILFLVFSLKAISQNTDTDIMVQRNNLSNVDFRDKSTKGTRFVTTEFIYGQTSNPVKNILFKYDAYQDEIEVKIDNQSNIFLRKKLGFKVTFENQAYQIFKDEEDKLVFFIISNSCKENCLLIKQKKELTAAVEPKNGYQTYQPAKFSDTEELYYVTFDGENAKEIPNKKKEFYTFFGSKEKEIKDYMKKNKLTRKNKEDLTKIIAFFKTI